MMKVNRRLSRLFLGIKKLLTNRSPDSTGRASPKEAHVPEPALPGHSSQNREHFVSVKFMEINEPARSRRLPIAGGQGGAHSRQAKMTAKPDRLN